MMVMMPAFAFVVVLMLMVMPAFAFVVVLMLMVMPAFAFVVVLMLMVMTAFTLVVMLMVSALAFMVVLVVSALALMAVLVVSALAFVVVMMIVMMLAFGLQVGKLFIQSITAFHGGEYLGAGQLIPGGGDEGSVGIMLSDEGNCSGKLVRGHACGAGEHDGICMLYLVVEELAKVLHVHFALVGVYYCGKAVELQFFSAHALNSADNVAELAYAGGLDENAVGGVLLQHLPEGLAKVAHKAAADAAGIHLGYLNARFLEEAAVNADLAEFVFYKYQLFPVECLGDELLDESSLACAQEAGKNIYLCHGLIHLFSLYFAEGNGKRPSLHNCIIVRREGIYKGTSVFFPRCSQGRSNFAINYEQMHITGEQNKKYGIIGLWKRGREKKKRAAEPCAAF